MISLNQQTNLVNTGNKIYERYGAEVRKGNIPNPEIRTTIHSNKCIKTNMGTNIHHSNT